jgi:maltooligosyltrehalose trehalohydrolase
VQQLLSLRHRYIVPHLAGMAGAGIYRCENDMLQVQWDLVPSAAEGAPALRLHMLAHFGAQPVEGIERCRPAR